MALIESMVFDKLSEMQFRVLSNSFWSTDLFEASTILSKYLSLHCNNRLQISIVIKLAVVQI